MRQFLSAVLLYFVFLATADAAPFMGAYSPGIGGITIGTAGTGFHSGYTLAAGDDFVAPLNIVNISGPLNHYFPTKAYSAGARGNTGQLAMQYDNDPYNFGAQDANRGVALGSNNISQAGSLITLLARVQNSNETGKIGSGRSVTTAMIDTSGYVTFSPPCIIEAYVKLPVNNPSLGAVPSGWHPTFWIRNSNSPNAGDTPGLEYDMEADTYNGSAPNAFHNNVNAYTAPGWVSSEGNGTTDAVFDSKFHLLSMELTTTFIKYYLDGTLQATVSGDTTSPNKPYYALFTNHLINPTTISDWVTAGATGMPMVVDYYRIWLPTAQYPSAIIQPTQNLPNIQVAYNTPITYIFPSATALWGSAITDYVSGRKFEDYEPGSSTDFTGNYIQFPPGLTYNSGTRTLTGITSDLQPGRIHTMATPAYQAGGAVEYVARGYIDVGPNITNSSISYSNSAASYDLYSIAKCGTLLPKTMSVTGLPAGLSFNPSTFLITGTATIGSYTINVSTTNSSGQSASQNITLAVTGGSSAPTLDGSATNFGNAQNGMVTLSTTQINDVIIVDAAVTGNAGAAASSVSDTAGLTWTKRTSQTIVSGTEMSEWWAVSSGILTSDVITINGNANATGFRHTAFGVNNANTTTPFDTNVSLPAKSLGTTATALTETISTTHPNDMLIAFLRSTASLGTVTEPSGFTQIQGSSATDASYEGITSTQSNLGVAYSWTGATTNSGLIVDAIQGN